MHKTMTAAALLGALGTAQAKPQRLTPRNIITALPENADGKELKYQPLIDFDKDGCYNTAAVDPDGNVNEGHEATGTPEGDCRDAHQLENSNVYSRARCNNGYCGILYEYYFEKDQTVSGTFAGGHKHDWENIVVFVKDDDEATEVLRVSPSCHGKYDDALDISEGKIILKDGAHPYMVYHKDGTVGEGTTHCFRPADQEDVDGPENFSGDFYRSPLVGWNGWPNDSVWQALVDEWPSGVCPKWLDSEFEGALRDALGDALPEFDPALDG
ncbi:hypothetical protein ACO1O0_008648 [Amphichorda felina]